jgi:hypothetical protein
MPHVADNDYVVQLQEWLMREGLTYPSMPMEGAHPNYFTINGKAYPATDTIHMALAVRPESARSLRALIGNVTEPPGGLFRLPGAFSRHEFSADYTISMFGFNFRQGQE